LQKVKNQQLASDFRRLRSKTSLMFQLLIYDALGDWENVNKFSDRIQAVTAEDVQRVVKKYFKPENWSVAIYNTKEGGGARPGPPGRPRPPGGAQ
jgi:zinc protease